MDFATNPNKSVFKALKMQTFFRCCDDGHSPAIFTSFMLLLCRFLGNFVIFCRKRFFFQCPFNQSTRIIESEPKLSNFTNEQKIAEIIANFLQLIRFIDFLLTWTKSSIFGFVNKEFKALSFVGRGSKKFVPEILSISTEGWDAE